MDYFSNNYDYKVFKLDNKKLTEVKDFDFSDIEVKADFDEIEYIYITLTMENLISETSIDEFMGNLLFLLTKYSKVRVIVVEEIEEEVIDNIFEDYDLHDDRIEFYDGYMEEIWIRDTFPTFAKKKSTGETVAIQMFFDYWGAKDKEGLLIAKDERKAVLDCIKQFPDLKYIVQCNYVHDGGARSFNGKGSCMLIENYERKRNKDFTKEKTEELFKKIFNIKNIIWIPYSSVWDDTDYKEKLYTADKDGNKETVHQVIATDGHIDGFATFLNPSTIAYVTPPNGQINELEIENTKRKNENLEALKNAVDQDGNKFNLIAVPQEIEGFEYLNPNDDLFTYSSHIDPNIIKKYKKDKKKMKVQKFGCYINFICLNGAIIGNALYDGKNEKYKNGDQELLKVLKTACPDREISMINTHSINGAGGSLHCITMHQPK